MDRRRLVVVLNFVCAALAPLTAEAADYGATYSPGAIQSLCVGNSRNLPVTVTNTGTLTWDRQAYKLSYHWYPAGTVPAGSAPPRPGDPLYEGIRSELTQPVGTQQKLPVQATVKAPSTPGSYTLKWDMVREGVTWFSSKGVPTADQQVTVRPNVDCLSQLVRAVVFRGITNGPERAYPESVVILGGKGLGTTRGKAVLKGQFPGGSVNLEVLAWHDNVVGAKVPPIAGVIDHPAMVQLVTSDGRVHEWPLDFVADREIRWLVVDTGSWSCSRNAWRNWCNGHGDLPLRPPTAGFRIPPLGTLVAYHQSGIVLGARGEDNVQLFLKNGWAMHDFDLDASPSLASGPKGFVKGSSQGQLAVDWVSGEFFSTTHYALHVYIIGPKGVPHR